MGRFAYLVDSSAGMEGFKALYHIPQGVSMRYCPLGEWHTLRKEGEVVIPMIAFIEGGMRLPMNRMTKDYLIAHKICPHQCAPNPRGSTRWSTLGLSPLTRESVL